MDAIFRSILSIIAILGVISLGRYEAKTGTKVNDFVLRILGSAVIGLNGKEVITIIDYLRGRKE